jgi:hypothetical protein
MLEPNTAMVGFGTAFSSNCKIGKFKTIPQAQNWFARIVFIPKILEYSDTLDDEVPKQQDLRMKRPQVWVTVRSCSDNKNF